MPDAPAPQGSVPDRRPGRPVAEDLLLLAVGSRARFLTRGPVATVVAAGAVADEVLAGRPLAGLAPDRVGLAGHLTGSAPARLAATTRSLVDARAVEPHRVKVLGLFPRDGLAVVDPAALARAQVRLREALRPGLPPTAADAALAATASVAGLARVHAPVGAPEERLARRAHVGSLPAVLGQDLTELVMALRVALGRLEAAAAAADGGPVLVPDADHDGYGDAGGAGSGSDSSGGDSSGGGDGGGGGD